MIFFLIQAERASDARLRGGCLRGERREPKARTEAAPILIKFPLARDSPRRRSARLLLSQPFPHRLRFSPKSDYLFGTRKIPSCSCSREANGGEARSLPLEQELPNTLAPPGERRWGGSAVTFPITIADHKLVRQLLFFLADGSDGIYLPAHGNKQERALLQPACLWRRHKLGPSSHFSCDPPARSPLLPAETTTFLLRFPSPRANPPPWLSPG